ncbi:unnamed protein product [Fusarium graminearum]|nr:unnamed protein product [Fusarium graminearum]
MAGEYDCNFLLSFADEINFTQWIDEYFHESTSKFDLTDMDLLENFTNPERHIDRLGSPEEFFDDGDLAQLMSPTMQPEPPVAPTAGSDESVTAKAESPELFDFASLGNDGMADQDMSGVVGAEGGGFEGPVSTALAPAAQSLRVESDEPVADYRQESLPTGNQVNCRLQIHAQRCPPQLRPQVQNQYQLPVQVQDHTPAQFDCQVQTQALAFQRPLHQQYTLTNQYIQGNYQPVNFHQGFIPSQPDPPQPQPQPQFHFPSVTPYFSPTPFQPPRPAIEQPPKKYRAPLQPTAQTPKQAWLVPKLEIFTRQYQGFINTPKAAREIEWTFLSMSHPPESATTTHAAVDTSFPQTSQEYSNRNVIHRRLSDIEIELLCAKVLASHLVKCPYNITNSYRMKLCLLSRVETSFLYGATAKRSGKSLTLNKVLIHSALRASWISRITNSPFSETRRKDQNKAGNDRKRTLIEQVENGRRRPANEQGGGKQKRAKI